MAVLTGACVAGCQTPATQESMPTPQLQARPKIVCTDQCVLGALGTAHGVLVGAAVRSNRLNDPRYSAAVVANFNSITAEYEMKWRTAHPTASTWNWAGADAIVDFATRHHLAIKGHALVWGKPEANPDWLMAVTDPVAFRTAVTTAITTEVTRYRGRVDRWDVVNEPLQRHGTGLDHNAFYERMGPQYIDDAFRIAHAADPNAELWLNETDLEYGSGRGDSLIELVRALRARGVPIQGVGLQTHLVSTTPLAVGHVASLVSRLRALGVKVAITEMDIPTGQTRPVADQTELYGRIAGECLQAGCSEITTWGVSDGATWLDDPATRRAIATLKAFATPSNPLLLDRDYRPKDAYRAVADAVSAAPTAR